MRYNSEMFEVAKTLKPGDVIEYRVLMRRPQKDEVESCKISSITVREDKEQVDITYVPCRRPNSVQCGFGCTFIAPENGPGNTKGEWGWQWIKKVGEESTVAESRWYPRPGNVGFDLMC